MTAKRSLFLLSAVLAIGLLAGLSFRRPVIPVARFSFEGIPTKVFADLKIAAAQKPQLARSASGTLSVLAVEDSEGSRRLIYTQSQDDGDHFNSSIRVSDPGTSVIASGDNIPSLVQTEAGLYSAWQERTPEGRHRIMFARSKERGGFEKPIEVTDHKGSSFNGFAAMNIAPNGDIYVIWLDGRDEPEPEGTLALYLAKSTDGGKSFGQNIRIVLGVCPCCRPAIAFGKNGEVYVSWRKVFDGNVRDVVLAASHDGGKTFSAAVKVGEDQWVIHGCPDSGPSMVNIGERLYIAWYSEGNHTSGIRVATSDNGGKSFTIPDVVSKGVLAANHPQLSIFDSNHVMLSFQGRRESRNQEHWSPVQIFVTTLDPLGRGAAPEPLPSVNSSAVYPTAISAGPNRIFVAWTDVNEASASVELSRGVIH